MDTVNPNIINSKDERLPGKQIMALCHYLEKVSAIHPAVSYKALWAYLERNYRLDKLPLNFETVQRIVYDFEMRRNQTKVLLEQYVAWYKDPLMRKQMKKRYPRTKRRKVRALFDRDIKMLWPTIEGRWPDQANKK